MMERTTVAKQEWEVITTHVLDRHNDYIQIYAKPQGGGWLLSDGGDTLADAAQSGCEVDTPRFQAGLADALAALGVRQVRDALEIEASADTLGAQKRCLLQAIVAINGMVEETLAAMCEPERRRNQ